MYTSPMLLSASIALFAPPHSILTGVVPALILLRNCAKNNAFTKSSM